MYKIVNINEASAVYKKKKKNEHASRQFQTIIMKNVNEICPNMEEPTAALHFNIMIQLLCM